MPRQKTVHYTPFTAPEQHGARPDSSALPHGELDVLQMHVRFHIVSSHFLRADQRPCAMNSSPSVDHRARADRGRPVRGGITYRNGRGANPDAFAR